MEKFIFTDDRNDLWEDRDRLTTCIDGVRYVGDIKEELCIIAILSTTEPAKVVYLRYKNSNLISREVETFTDTMELVKRVKKYVDNLEELKDMEDKKILTAFEYAKLRREILEDWDNNKEKADKALDFIIGDSILPLDKPLTSSQLFELRKEAYHRHIYWGWNAVNEAYKYAIKGLKNDNKI